MRSVGVVAVAAALFFAGCGVRTPAVETAQSVLWPAERSPTQAADTGQVTEDGAVPSTPSESTESEASTRPFVAPISNAAARVTKKPFGLLVQKASSPVQPERFSGYHVGTDYEVEEDAGDVTIFAACDGTLLVKRSATGYGGVLVQSCALGGEAVTVVYGHMRLSSVAHAVGGPVKQGERLGELGTGYSAETDGERRHLHLGIHRGAAVDIRGYVQSAGERAAWIDAESLLGTRAESH